MNVMDNDAECPAQKLSSFSRIAFRTAKMQWSFGRSECNKVNGQGDSQRSKYHIFIGIDL